jgi:hypothetical protein
MHGLRDSNSRHLVLETSALPTELNPQKYSLQIFVAFPIYRESILSIINRILNILN